MTVVFSTSFGFVYPVDDCRRAMLTTTGNHASQEIAVTGKSNFRMIKIERMLKLRLKI